MKTKPTKDARRASTKSAQRKAPTPASGAVDDAPRTWNTLGVASLFATTPARVMRAVACGDLTSTVRIVGGDQKPRFAFTLFDVATYARLLVKRAPESETGAAAKRFLDSVQ